MPRTPRVDPPPQQITIGEDENGHLTISAVLSEVPGIVWTYSCSDLDGEALILIRTIKPTDPRHPIRLDALPKLIAKVNRHLAYHWRIALDAGFDPLDMIEQRLRPVAPSARPYSRNSEDPWSHAEYKAKMHAWSAPIADEIRRAERFNVPRHWHLAQVFGVSEKRAEALVRLARKAGHEITPLRPLKEPEHVDPVPSIGTGRRRPPPR